MTETRVIIGAMNRDKPGDNSSQGAAFVYERGTGGQWTLLHELVTDHISRRPQFGNAVATDGNVALVGEWNSYGTMRGQKMMFGAGAAYIFVGL